MKDRATQMAAIIAPSIIVISFVFFISPPFRRQAAAQIRYESGLSHPSFCVILLLEQ
jgi:hypothetical protein